MPLDTPAILNTFTLGGYRMEVTAPTEIRERVKAHFKHWFFKNGPTVTQKGRVVPEPIGFQFTFNGDWALDAAMHLKRLHRDQKEIDFSWAQRFSCLGYLEDFEFTYRQQVVEGSLTFQAVRDLLEPLANPFVISRSATAPPTLMDLVSAIEDIGDTIRNTVGTVQTAINNAAKPLTDTLDAIDKLTTTVNGAIASLSDISNMPIALGARIISQADDVLNTVGDAQSFVLGEVLAPPIPIMAGTTEFVTKAGCLIGLTAMEDAKVYCAILRDTVAPPPVTYTVVDGDTVDLIVSLFDVALIDLVDANPGLCDSNLVAGRKVVIPNG